MAIANGRIVEYWILLRLTVMPMTDVFSFTKYVVKCHQFYGMTTEQQRQRNKKRFDIVFILIHCYKLFTHLHVWPLSEQGRRQPHFKINRYDKRNAKPDNNKTVIVIEYFSWKFSFHLMNCTSIWSLSCIRTICLHRSIEILNGFWHTSAQNVIAVIVWPTLSSSKHSSTQNKNLGFHRHSPTLVAPNLLNVSCCRKWNNCCDACSEALISHKFSQM